MWVCAHAQPYQVCLAHYSSDGMSRTGVFVTCVSEIERVKFEGGVDIFQTVKAARTQRPHMVNTSVSYCIGIYSTACNNPTLSMPLIDPVAMVTGLLTLRLNHTPRHTEKSHRHTASISCRGLSLSSRDLNVMRGVRALWSIAMLSGLYHRNSRCTNVLVRCEEEQQS